MKNIFSELSSKRNYLSKTEEKIAEIIFNNPESFITYSMAKLAEISGVSQGSINNFAKKFSEGGFSDLKLMIASQLSSFKSEFSCTPAKECDNSGIKDLMENSIKNNYLAFKNTLGINSISSFESVAEKILSAKRIEIYGLYHSGTVANDFYFQLLRIGIPVNFISDIITCAVSASTLDSDCLVIAISTSGRTRDIIEAVNIAKSNNVPIVAFTANPNSPLAKLSDDVLVAATSGSSSFYTQQELRHSLLLLIDTIYNYIRFKTDLEGSKHYNCTKKILNSHSIKELE